LLPGCLESFGQSRDRNAALALLDRETTFERVARQLLRGVAQARRIKERTFALLLKDQISRLGTERRQRQLLADGAR